MEGFINKGNRETPSTPKEEVEFLTTQGYSLFDGLFDQTHTHTRRTSNRFDDAACSCCLTKPGVRGTFA